jgi:hypothetical protein
MKYTIEIIRSAIFAHAMVVVSDEIPRSNPNINAFSAVFTLSFPLAGEVQPAFGAYVVPSRLSLGRPLSFRPDVAP